jgi:hypothetical protein
MRHFTPQMQELLHSEIAEDKQAAEKLDDRLLTGRVGGVSSAARLSDERIKALQVARGKRNRGDVVGYLRDMRAAAQEQP